MDEEPQVLGDIELGAIRRVVGALLSLPDDESRRRVIAYAQSRCIRPAAEFAYAQRQDLGQREQPKWLGQLNPGAIQK